MTKRKKQVFGLLGLAFVAAITAVAYALPASDAAAEGVKDTQVQNGTNITVNVTDGTETQPTINIIQPLDGDILVSDSDTLPVKIRYSAINSYSVSLSCAKKDGGFVSNSPQTSVHDGAGEAEITMSVAELRNSGDADCKLTATGNGIRNGQIVQVKDDVAFKYRAVGVTILDRVDPSKNPIAEIRFRKDVARIEAMVFDKHNNPVFVKNGKDEPVVVGKDQLNFAALVYEMVLPMNKYGAKAGDYTLVVTAFNEAGETISVNTEDFKYNLDVPNVPGTGSVLEDLNISRIDYILTGLIAFGAVAGFAIYLVVRKNRR